MPVLNLKSSWSNQSARFRRPVIIGIAVVLSMAAIRPYVYAANDLVVVIPFLKAWADPALYSGDIMVALSGSYYTIFLPLLATLHRLHLVPLAAMFFLGAVICLAFSYGLLLAIAQELFRRPSVALIALLFLLFPLPLIGGQSYPFDYFLPRLLAQPLLLASFLLLLRRRVYAAFAACAIGFLIHPLSASYMFAVLVFASLGAGRRIGWRRTLTGPLVFLLLISPMLLWRFFSPGLGGSLFHADQQWLAILRTRTSDPFPSAWPPVRLLASFMPSVMLAFALRWQPAGYHRRAVGMSLLAVAALISATFVFVDFIPLPIVIQFQFHRSTKIINWLVVIYAANLFMGLWSGRVREYRGWVGLGMMVVLMILSPGRWAGLAALLTLTAGLAWQKYRCRCRQFGKPVLAAALVAAAVSLGVYGTRFSYGPAQSSRWLAVQDWARTATPTRAWFIVPPYFKGFRTRSERCIYAAWKDGTLSYFSPDYAFRWWPRMKALGFRPTPGKKAAGYNPKNWDYDQFSAEQFRAVAEKAGNPNRPVYLVKVKGGRRLDLPVTFENSKFLVYELLPAGSPPSTPQPGSGE